MNPTPELWSLLGVVAVSAFALARLSLGNQSHLADRLGSILEESLRRQAEAWTALEHAVAALDVGLRDQAGLIRRILERIGPPEPPAGGPPCR